VKYSLEEIGRLSFLMDLDSAILDSRYKGEELEIVKKLVPVDIGDQWDKMLSSLLEEVKELSQEDLAIFIRGLPSGYVRMMVRFRYTQNKGGIMCN